MAFVLFIKSVANLLTNRAAIQWCLAWGCALPVTAWEETNHHVDLKADIWLHQRSAQIVSTVILAMSNWFNNISCVISFDCNSTPFTRDACVNILQRIFMLDVFLFISYLFPVCCFLWFPWHYIQNITVHRSISLQHASSMVWITISTIDYLWFCKMLLYWIFIQAKSSFRFLSAKAVLCSRVQVKSQVSWPWFVFYCLLHGIKPVKHNNETKACKRTALWVLSHLDVNSIIITL